MPRAQLALIAGVLAAAGGLALLSARSLESQRVLLERAAAESGRAEAARAAAEWRASLDRACAPLLEAIPAGGSAGTLGQALESLEARPEVAAAFALDRAGRVSWPPAPAPARAFVEVLPGDDAARSRLAAGYRAEFREQNPDAALSFYASAGLPQFGQTVRVEAKLQQAALAARLGRVESAIAAYGDALTMGRFADPERVVLATVERARLLRAASPEAAEEEILRFAESLWGADAARFGTVVETARASAEAALAGWPLSAKGRERREALLSAAARRRAVDAVREHAASASLLAARPFSCATLDGGRLLVAARPRSGGGSAGVVLRAESLALDGPGALVADGVAWRGAAHADGLAAPLPGAAGLSAVVPPSPHAAASLRRQRFLYASGLAVLLAALAAGLVMSFRAVKREAELAKLKSDFVANVSHELKTPLALVRMYAETLALGRVSGGTQTREYLEVIQRESERLSAMIERILDFAKIERGERVYERRAGDLAAAARAGAEEFTRRTGTPVEVRADAPVRADFDADGVALALRNLLENAAKYSDGEPHVAVSVAERNGSAEVAVEDRGIGVPAADRERIFERFYRSADPRGRGVKGTGLGLALVAHVMEGHGGGARCEPRAGGGSRFVLVFPGRRDAADDPGR